MRCKRCTHFNLHCSLEGSPPRPKGTVLPSLADSFPQVPPSPPHGVGVGAGNNNNINGGAQQQHSRRSSPPRTFGPNSISGPSPPNSAQRTRDRYSRFVFLPLRLPRTNAILVEQGMRNALHYGSEFDSEFR